MAENGAAQRHYRAPCPGCGAPVEFRSAQSTHAVCPYCQSTVVRSGEQLSRIGKMAELFDDFSPLQLFTTGRLQGQAFTLVGRLQYSYDGGRWTEWVAQLDSSASPDSAPAGSLATLSEDNGAFVFSVPYTLKRPAPEAQNLRVGITTAIDGQPFTVTSNQEVWLNSAQGELSHLPALGERFRVVELRNDQGLVLSLDYSSAPPAAALGRGVQLADLQLSGLRDHSDKEESGGRQFNCPNCGAPVHVALDSSKSVTCASCRSLIDLSAGVGGELSFALQHEPVQPLIPLGSKAHLTGTQWQVVGFQHRVGREAGDDESFGWSEYLLYNRQRGFSFLVDATDGWSLVAPTTGAPRLAPNGQSASYLGKTYPLLYSYEAETTYVVGEFYWQVARGHKTRHMDFALKNALLSREQDAQELSWSSGDRLQSSAVANAFGMGNQLAKFKRDEVKPFSAAPSMSIGTMITILIVIIILISLMDSCSGNSGSSYRSSGGSYGGYSSGGSHK